MMKGTAVFLAGLLLIPGVQALAVDQAKMKTGAPVVAADTRITKMKAAGTVTEISDTVLKIERTIKDKMENMEFVLEKPVTKIMVGDKVQVSYVTKENRNVAMRVTKNTVKKIIPKTTINAKPVGNPPRTAPVAK